MTHKKLFLLIGLVLVVVGISTFSAAHALGVVFLVLAIVTLITSVARPTGPQQ